MTLLLLAALALQRPAAPAPVRDTTVRDSVTRFLENFNYRGLGPAAYSGRVTAIAVPRSSEPRPKTFYIGSAGGGVWETSNGGVTPQSGSGGVGSGTAGDPRVAPSRPHNVWGGTGDKSEP